MSAHQALPRPRQVTTAGVMGVAGSALVVLSLFDALQRLRSVEMREAVDQFLAEPPGDGLGVSTGWVLDALHGLVLVNGALAAVAAVFAVYVFQRNQAARVGFSVAAGLLLLTSPLSGGAMAMIVAFAATMLWGRPARDWFAGRQPATQAAAGNRQPAPERPDPWALPGSRPDVTQDEQLPGRHDGPSAGQRPAAASYPFGSRPDPGWAPPAFDQQPSTPVWAVGTAQDPDRRPASVAVAAAITWFFAGVSTLMFLLVVLMLMVGQDALVEALRADARFDELDMSVDDLLAAVWVVSAVAIFWSVSAVALAVLAFRRVGWARVALAVSAVMTVLFSVGALPVSLLVIVPAAATVALLFTRSANAWFSRTPRSLEPPPGGPTTGPAQPPAPPQGKPPVW